MASRRVSPQVQQLFEKYLQGDTPGRRLRREDAVNMLIKELSISAERSEMIFDHFDKDGNGFMSLWEFQHLYNIAGSRATEIIQLYESTDVRKKDYLTKEEVQGVLKDLKTSDDQNLDAKEIEMFSKTAGTNELVTFGDFIDLYARVKLYKKPKKR